MRWVIRLLLAAFTLCIFFEFHLPAQIWTQTSAPITNWSSVASSADGSKLVAAVSGGLIYASTNGGAIWQPTSAPTGSWQSLCSSADGSILAATAIGTTYISKDSGITWQNTNSPGGTWLSCSADGNKMFALVGWQLFASTNAGSSWKDLSLSVIPVGFHFIAVASSADGNENIVLSGGSGSVGFDTHADLWAGWTAASTEGALGNGRTASVASSAGGNKLAAYLNGIGPFTPGGRLYTSANAGSTWTVTVVSATNLTSITSSADGIRLAAVATGDTIYMSTNSGTNWIPVNVPVANWVSVSSSADGNRMVAAANGGGIYTWQTTAQPSLSVVGSASGLLISWILPSQKFVLQQSFDLASTHWTNVPVTPLLNLTNLHNEVTIPAPTDNAFYRVMSE
jgi:hypothetical protein